VKLLDRHKKIVAAAGAGSGKKVGDKYQQHDPTASHSYNYGQ